MSSRRVSEAPEFFYLYRRGSSVRSNGTMPPQVLPMPQKAILTRESRHLKTKWQHSSIKQTGKNAFFMRKVRFFLKKSLTSLARGGIITATYLNALMELFLLFAIFQRVGGRCEPILAVDVKSHFGAESSNNSKRLRMVPLS